MTQILFCYGFGCPCNLRTRLMTLPSLKGSKTIAGGKRCSASPPAHIDAIS
jgi:hypothetical protein